MEYHTISDPFGRAVDRLPRLIDLRSASESMRHAYSLPAGFTWVAVVSEFMTETVSSDHAVGIDSSGLAVEWSTGWDEPFPVDALAADQTLLVEITVANLAAWVSDKRDAAAA